MRRWTAIITLRARNSGVQSDAFAVSLNDGTPHWWDRTPDLLSEITKIGVKQAITLLTENRQYGWNEATVTLYKTTQAHGTRRDRSFYIYESDGKFYRG